MEEVTLDRLFDPSSRPERLVIVSGSLKMVGGNQGTWASVSHIPIMEVPALLHNPRPTLSDGRGDTDLVVALNGRIRRTAAPRSDRGLYTRFGNRVAFYSFLTGSTYQGEIFDQGDQMVIRKQSRAGLSQTETYYLGR